MSPKHTSSNRHASYVERITGESEVSGGLQDRREEYEKPAYDHTTGEIIRKDRTGMAKDAADALQQVGCWFCYCLFYPICIAFVLRTWPRMLRPLCSR